MTNETLTTLATVVDFNGLFIVALMIFIVACAVRVWVWVIKVRMYNQVGKYFKVQNMILEHQMQEGGNRR